MTAGPTGRAAARALEVLEGGFLTTVQDAGRPDWTHLGVPESGAADRWSLAVANLLAGNAPGTAALELTLAGPTLRVQEATVVALAGADLGARTRAGRRLAPGRSYRLAAGDIVEIPGAPAATSGQDPGARAGTGGPGQADATGARAYLAIRGGIDVPVVLGSRSTCLAGGFGGLEGRALRAGDRLPAGRDGSAPPPAAADLVWPAPDPDISVHPVGDRARVDAAGVRHANEAAVSLRVLAGPAPGADALAAGRWRVSPASDRVGVRLDGEPLPPGIAGETTTHGVPWGAIQVPPGGLPIILGADHQVTGGYPVVAVVISADLPVLGQLRPRVAVRLDVVDRAAAIDALRRRRDALLAGAAALRDAARWDALTESAGG